MIEILHLTLYPHTLHRNVLFLKYVHVKNKDY